MKKYLAFTLLVLLLALTACNNASKSEGETPVAAATPTVAPATATPAERTAVPVAAEPTAEAPGCYASSIGSLIDMQPNTAIAAVSDADLWQSGGDASARVTVVEYGDFQ